MFNVLAGSVITQYMTCIVTDASALPVLSGQPHRQRFLGYFPCLIPTWSPLFKGHHAPNPASPIPPGVARVAGVSLIFRNPVSFAPHSHHE
jgi:hypothetical protein